jgi:O-antigen/teichoic acid export membrane protein
MLSNTPYISDKKKLIKNFLWLFFDRLFGMVLGIIMSTLIARYLMPSDYGLLSFYMAIIYVIAPLTTLGLEPIILKEVANNPDKEHIIVGTAFILRFMGGLFGSTISILGAYLWIEEGSMLLFIILSLRLIALSLEVFDHYTKAILKPKYAVLYRNIILILFSIIKMIWIWKEGSLIQLAYISTMELISLGMTVAFIVHHKWLRFRVLKFDINTAKLLFKQGWGLFISDFLVAAFFRVDQLMLGVMLNTTAVGVYAAGLRLLEAVTFVPQVVMNTLFPQITIITNKLKQDKLFLNTLKILFFINIIITLTIYIVGEPIILLILGGKYKETSDILLVLSLGIFFTFSGVVRGFWMLQNKLQHYHIHSALIGFIILIPANLVLIPKYGMYGAAIGTVIAYASSAYLSSWLLPSLRPFAKMQTQAIYFWKINYV